MERLKHLLAGENQLADLVARPIGRHVMNATQSNRAFDVLRKNSIPQMVQ
jgi:hypothetical protein